MTVSELVQQIYSSEFAQAFDKVDLEVAVDDAASASVDTVSGYARKAGQAGIGQVL